VVDKTLVIDSRTAVADDAWRADGENNFIVVIMDSING